MKILVKILVRLMRLVRLVRLGVFVRLRLGETVKTVRPLPRLVQTLRREFHA